MGHQRALDDVLCGLHKSLYVDNEKRYNTTSGELGYPNEMVRGCLADGLEVDGVTIAHEIEMMGIKTPDTLRKFERYWVEIYRYHAQRITIYAQNWGVWELMIHGQMQSLLLI